MRLKLSHPIYRYGGLSEAWDWFDNPTDAEKRLSSLRMLAQFRELMPGAARFNVPEGAFDDEKWAPVIAASQSVCLCPLRRIMYPTQGRTRLLPYRPDAHLRTLEFADGYSVGDGYNSPALAIAPRGGSIEDAYAAFMIKQGGLLVDARPFMQHRPPDKKHFWTPHDGIATRSPLYWHASHEVIKDALRLHGEVPFLQVMPDPDGRDSYLGSMPLCTLTEASDPEKGPMRFTFEVDASVHSIPRVRQDFPEHECPAPA
jgi:hypothetical protein